MGTDVGKLLLSARAHCTDAGVVSDPRFLETAMLMSTLSAAVYDDPQATAVESLQAELPVASVANQRVHFKPEFNSQHSNLQSDSCDIIGKHSTQYGIWEVAGLGVVLALKDFPNLQDKLVGVSHDFCEVQSEPQMLLNSSIYKVVEPCCKNIALACHSLCCGKGTSVPLYITGHSTAGSMAVCIYLHLACAEPSLRPSLAYGGVYSFGAPPVVYISQASGGNAAQCLAQHLGCPRESGVTLRLPMHSFVNNLDVVPYLTSPSSVQPLLDALRPVLPSSMQRILVQSKSSGGSFTNLGSTHIMIADKMKTVDKFGMLLQEEHLQLCQQIAATCQNTACRELLFIRSLHDHLASSYSSKLQEAVKCIVPVLFMGGILADYEAVRIKRMSAAGSINSETALRHISSGTVGHSAFSRIRGPDLTFFMAATPTRVEAETAAQPAQPRSTWIPSLSTVSQGASIVSSVGTTAYHVAQLAGGAAAHGVVTAGVLSAVCPPLGIASLAASVLNIGLTGYSIYQLRQVSQKLGKLDEKMDGIVASTTRTAEVVSRMDDELATVKMITHAIAQGVQHQTAVMQQVLNFCDQIRAAQDHIISNQVQLMSAILATKAQVDLILQTINSNDLKARRKLLSRFACDMKNHLTNPEDSHFAHVLLVSAQDVQIDANQWLDDLKDQQGKGEAAEVACRLPLLAMFAFAAVGVDAANVVIKAAHTQRMEDIHEDRQKVVEKVNASIINLLQSTTPYTMAVQYHEVLAQLVYLRRAMHGSVDVAQVIASVGGASGQDQASTSCVHDAADLLWTDGLESVRQLFAKGRHVSADSHALGPFFSLDTLQDVAWFCQWKGLADSTSILLSVPKIQLAEMCAMLGIPAPERQEALQQLRQQDLQLLQQTVLPEYLMGVVTILDAQLPGLDICRRYERHELFMRLEESSVSDQAVAETKPAVNKPAVCNAGQQKRDDNQCNVQEEVESEDARGNLLAAESEEEVQTPAQRTEQAPGPFTLDHHDPSEGLQNLAQCWNFTGGRGVQLATTAALLCNGGHLPGILEEQPPLLRSCSVWICTTDAPAKPHLEIKVDWLRKNLLRTFHNQVFLRAHMLKGSWRKLQKIYHARAVVILAKTRSLAKMDDWSMIKINPNSEVQCLWVQQLLGPEQEISGYTVDETVTIIPEVEEEEKGYAIRPRC